MPEQRKKNKPDNSKILNSSFRVLAETSPTGIYLTDNTGQCLYVNPAWCRMAGLTPKEALGDGWIKAIHPDDSVRILSAWTDFVKGNIPWESEYRFSSAGGNVIWVYGTATLLKRKDGLTEGVIGVNLDITVRKQTEDELRKSKKLLEKLNQHLHKVWESEKSQIAMNLHDDLGQRLTGLYMDMAWLISRIGVQSAAVKKKFTGINENLNEIIEFIKDISFSLMPAILLELGIVPAIISHLKKFEAQSGIKCSFEYDPEEIVLEEGLSLIVYRVFQESLTNIARHSHACHTEVSLRMLNGNIELSVKDDGVGIDKDKIDSLASMGIAGIIARVKLVNGCVQFTGKKGSGTIVKATFPLIKSK
jgi:PAS domain S-box-containing protein